MSVLQDQDTNTPQGQLGNLDKTEHLTKGNFCHILRFHTVVDFFLFLLLAKMLGYLWVLVGSAIYNKHNNLKECNTSWISADSHTV